MPSYCVSIYPSTSMSQSRGPNTTKKGTQSAVEQQSSRLCRAAKSYLLRGVLFGVILGVGVGLLVTLAVNYSTSTALGQLVAITGPVVSNNNSSKLSLLNRSALFASSLVSQHQLVVEYTSVFLVSLVALSVVSSTSRSQAPVFFVRCLLTSIVSLNILWSTLRHVSVLQCEIVALLLGPSLFVSVFALRICCCCVFPLLVTVIVFGFYWLVQSTAYL